MGDAGTLKFGNGTAGVTVSAYEDKMPTAMSKFGMTLMVKQMVW